MTTRKSSSARNARRPSAPRWTTIPSTAALVFADGTALFGEGFGAEGVRVGEVCFQTAMSGYQEILTDPSYAAQLVVFSFPHIGNVGTNSEDNESAMRGVPFQRNSRLSGGKQSARGDKTPLAAQGLIVREPPTRAANYRAQSSLQAWLKRNSLVGIAGVNTRALVARIRDKGMFAAALAHVPSGKFSGKFSIQTLARKAKAHGTLEGKELARAVSAPAAYSWGEARWSWKKGYTARPARARKQRPHIVVLDYGSKRNILRCLASEGMRVSVMPAGSTARAVLAKKPDGLLLSNGPGDPEASSAYAKTHIQELLRHELPLFGICFGHQLLALALGASTEKMPSGHHGANHPVQDLRSGKVEIVSMNHGFCVARASLPKNVEETHVSLFDGTNCGIRVKNAPISSVQYHPEASPGPQDSFYLFRDFFETVNASVRIR